MNVDEVIRRAKLSAMGAYNSVHLAPDQLTEKDLTVISAKDDVTWPSFILSDKTIFVVDYNPTTRETSVDSFVYDDTQVFPNIN